ncbi:MarR family winged helix-turn-helix transcriptional regulator [Ornithinimicrobium sufpigmenti]|uniref:MarR family winged helix-turn-helix transcriptional regulator n=1 Tax=Ornithinimicrobium sufpigmenti TaxID=2508882 RepID=UPI001EDDDE0F|nr:MULTISPECIES: MarR family transcriptional regulator [unclassified Ornithinimicrobium]
MDSYPQLALDQQICLPLYAASRAVTRRYGELLAEVGLTYPQYLALLALWEAEGPLSVRELGDLLHLDSGTLTPLLKRMERTGLLTRVRDERDERRVLVSPTDQGWGLRARVADIPAQLAGGMGMTVAEGRTLRGLLDRVIGQLEPERGGGGAAAR